MSVYLKHPRSVVAPERQEVEVHSNEMPLQGEGNIQKGAENGEKGGVIFDRCMGESERVVKV